MSDASYVALFAFIVMVMLYALEDQWLLAPLGFFCCHDCSRERVCSWSLADRNSRLRICSGGVEAMVCEAYLVLRYF
jgi:hypothetical protein